GGIAADADDAPALRQQRLGRRLADARAGARHDRHSGHAHLLLLAPSRKRRTAKAIRSSSSAWPGLLPETMRRTGPPTTIDMKMLAAIYGRATAIAPAVSWRRRRSARKAT